MTKQVPPEFPGGAGTNRKPLSNHVTAALQLQKSRCSLDYYHCNVDVLLHAVSDSSLYAVGMMPVFPSGIWTLSA